MWPFLFQQNVMAQLDLFADIFVQGVQHNE